MEIKKNFIKMDKFKIKNIRIKIKLNKENSIEAQKVRLGHK